MAGKVTGDGRSDLIARKTDGTLWLYRNGVDNSAPYSTAVRSVCRGSSSRVPVGDVTVDGRADVVVAYVNCGNNTTPHGTGAAIGSDWHDFA